MSLYTTERQLEKLFDRYGRVEKVTIIRDRIDDRSRGFGFVTFDHEDDADKARKETNGIELDGRRIRVDFSVTKRAHTPTPGQYMGEARAAESSRRRSPRRSPPRRNRSRSRSPRRYRSRSRTPPRRSRRSRSRSRSPRR